MINKNLLHHETRQPTSQKYLHIKTIHHEIRQRKIRFQSTSIGYVMRYHHLKVLMAESKRIRDYDILVTECFVVREAILKTGQKGIQWVIIQSDVQLFVDSLI